MSVYKVPQDVEADDKLLGPFNFRQFIYLMVAGGLIALAIFLFQIFPGLIIIPAPFIIFFLVLSLPLKKDQPMELYLAAVLSFYLKPNKRIWQADGVEHLIEISAPIRNEENLIKDIGRDEASRRLSYLADIVDTQGWAIKHAVAQDHFQQDVFYEGQQMSDIFENHSANRIDSMLESHGNLRKQQIIKNMNTARNLADYTSANAEQIQAQTFATTNPIDLYADSLERAKIQQDKFLSWNNQQNQPQNQTPQPYNPPAPQPTTQQISQPETNDIKLQYNPYPNSIKQAVISPTGYQTQPSIQNQSATPPEQSEKPMDPEIMRLVSEGKDLSVETLARQANKIKQRREEEIDLNKEEEIVISLR